MVVAGHVCLDEIVASAGVTRAAGSPAVFMAPVLVEAGIEPLISAPHGADFDALGTGLRFLEPPAGAQTLLYVNDVRTERRRQSVGHADVLARDTAAPSPATRAALAGAAALVLTPLLPLRDELVAELVSLLPAGALRVALVQGYLRRLGTAVDGAQPVEPREFTEADAVLPIMDVAVLSEEDLGDPAAAHHAAGMWSAAHPSTAIVVTRGEAGASAYLRGERRDVPAHPVGVLSAANLVGAGDLFSAALVVSLLGAPREPTLDADTLVAAVDAANRATAERLAAR